MSSSHPVARTARRRFASVLSLTLTVLAAACGDATTSAPGDEIALARAPKQTNTVQVNIGGLPAGVNANVNVTGGGGFSRALTASATLTDLANGTYTVTAANVSSGGVTYVAAPVTQTVSVNKASTATANVTYTAATVSTGSLNVTVSIASGVAASVNVTGPNGFARSLTASASLTGLATGDYTVNAAVVTVSGTTYTPAPASQNVNVTAAAASSASIVYTASTPDPGAGLNLQIAGMYLTQSVQTMSGAVPLVAGREAMLRVFAVANGANGATPPVRARFYRNGALVSTLTANAAAASVPTALNEGSATASWNIRVPATLLTGGLTVIADVDPDNTVAESSETDNQYPVSGTPQAIDVRNVPALAVRFVPVLQSANGQLGNVSDANSASYLARLRDIHPVNVVTSSVRSPYTTSQAINNVSSEWSTVLSELRALRTADGSSEHYYGVAHVTYTSGTAGIGYIGLPAALGWDYLPSGSEVMAHELGHNWGRQHAPCGGVAGPDANFPYAGGTLGVFGFNVRLGQLIPSSTADLMGYCNPTWISDYTYKAVMNYRGTSAASITSAAATSSIVTSSTVAPGLLVWGRVAADGTITLEPAVSLTGRSVMPAAPGDYTVDAIDENGAPIFSVSFAPDLVAVEEGQAERHFAFLIPVSEADQQTLRTLRVRGNARSAERTARFATPSLVAGDEATLDATSGTATRVRWNASTRPMVVVRDPANGQILSFARGGDAAVASNRDSLDLIYTDGVRSIVQRTRVRGR